MSAKGKAQRDATQYEVQRRREALKRVEMAKDAASWGLCVERCAMFREGMCVCDDEAQDGCFFFEERERDCD